MLYNIPIPDFWLFWAIGGTFAAIIATTYVVITEYPPVASFVASLLKKVEIRLLVWKANHSRLPDEQREKFFDLIKEGEIDAVDIRQRVPPPGEPWFFVHSPRS